MKLLVTGASGFLGRYVVAESVRRGHDVRAMVRPVADIADTDWERVGRIEVVRTDLRSREGLVNIVRGVDAVVHLAAAKQGDLGTQLGHTLVGTENLLNAMVESGVHRLVAVSTTSVYDYLRMRGYAVVDESSPLERMPERRETYAHVKLLQEELIGGYVKNHDLAVTIARPGLIYGRDHLWTDQLGIRIGEARCIGFIVPTRLRVTYVENCACALVDCVESDVAVGETFNILDDDRPTRRQYMRLLRRGTNARWGVLPVPGLVVRGVARLAHWTNALVFGGGAKTPWFLTPSKLHVQLKPLRYRNARIHETLRWTSRYSFAEASERICRDSREHRPAAPTADPRRVHVGVAS